MQLGAARGTGDLVLSVLEKGVRLWAQGGQLNYRAPVGAIVQNEIDALHGKRTETLALLNNVSAKTFAGIGESLRRRVDYAPLALSQLLHWSLHELGNRQSARVVVLAMRLIGPLDLDALKTSIQTITDRHEALRTRIGIIGDKPVQVICGALGPEMAMDDLTMLSESARENELQLLIQKYVLEPVDVTKDFLFSTRLIKTASDEHVLISAMEHLVSDGSSLDILLRDIFEEYTSAVCGLRSSLPEIAVQFPDYAIWQRGMYRTLNTRSSQQWGSHFGDCNVLAHNRDMVSGGSLRPGLGYVPIRIEPELRAELLQWCRTKKTTLVMGVFTAFAALVLRWYEASEGMIQCQTSGRNMAEIQNTIGYFAFRLYLRTRVGRSDTFMDLLERMKAEYVTSCELGEFYSLHVNEAKPELTRSPCFNWFVHDPMGSEKSHGEDKGKIKCSRVRFEDGIRQVDRLRTDTELMLGIREAGNEMQATLMFSSAAICRESAEQFARNFLVFVKALLRHGEPIMQIELVS